MGSSRHLSRYSMTATMSGMELRATMIVSTGTYCDAAAAHGFQGSDLRRRHTDGPFSAAQLAFMDSGASLRRFEHPNCLLAGLLAFHAVKHDFVRPLGL